jgi:hypothetical protein
VSMTLPMMSNTRMRLFTLVCTGVSFDQMLLFR